MTCHRPNIDTLRVNGERLWDSLMELAAKIGATPKAASRLTSPTWTNRAATSSYGPEAGMTVTIDKRFCGFMRRASATTACRPSRPAAIVPTHRRRLTAAAVYWLAWRWCGVHGIETEAPVGGLWIIQKKALCAGDDGAQACS
jgi:N-carbamoyl-L-amino-acid hydrolase